MLKTGKVICPTCGGEVVAFDNLDVEVDTSIVTLFMVGECDHCRTHYQRRMLGINAFGRRT